MKLIFADQEEKEKVLAEAVEMSNAGRSQSYTNLIEKGVVPSGKTSTDTEEEETEGLSLKELKAKAKELGVKGFSSMSKGELEAAIEEVES